MTNYDIIFFSIAYFGGGIVLSSILGMAMNDWEVDPITSFFDLWLIYFPMICMIGFLAPVIMAIYSIGVIIYLLGKLLFDNNSIMELVKNDNIGIGIAYFIFMLVVFFWVWFRKNILGYGSIL